MFPYCPGWLPSKMVGCGSILRHGSLQIAKNRSCVRSIPVDHGESTHTSHIHFPTETNDLIFSWKKYMYAYDEGFRWGVLFYSLCQWRFGGLWNLYSILYERGQVVRTGGAVSGEQGEGGFWPGRPSPLAWPADHRRAGRGAGWGVAVRGQQRSAPGGPCVGARGGAGRGTHPGGKLAIVVSWPRAGLMAGQPHDLTRRNRCQGQRPRRGLPTTILLLLHGLLLTTPLLPGLKPSPPGLLGAGPYAAPWPPYKGPLQPLVPPAAPSEAPGPTRRGEGRGMCGQGAPWPRG